MEGLYSILFHGQLAESNGANLGERTLGDVPGVYAHKDGTADKAEGYMRFVDLLNDGVYWAVKFELLVNRSERIIPKVKTDQ